MTANRDSNPLVECLRRMMAELSSPDLTLARSGELRPRITGLLDALRDVPTAVCPATPVGRR